MFIKERWMQMRNKYWLDGIMGVVVGDALGLPVQFMYPKEIKNRKRGPVTGMEGYGTFNMPEGTWSDDSSMTLATLDSINIKKRLDPGSIMINFLRWYAKGEYTPFGQSFDHGSTCIAAITNFSRNPDYKTCGKKGEYANGNGALMRIMPVCLYAYDKNREDPTYDDNRAIADIHDIAALTHNHLRSNMACGLYYFCVKEILNNKDKQSLQECLQRGIDAGLAYYRKDIANLTELAHFGRLFNLDELKYISDKNIRFSGYVVDSLEAAVWSLINTTSFSGGLLKAVNYGDDSDTVAAIAGGLAGLYYGIDEIPSDWLAVIQKREWIEQMVMEH